MCVAFFYVFFCKNLLGCCFFGTVKSLYEKQCEVGCTVSELRAQLESGSLGSQMGITISEDS